MAIYIGRNPNGDRKPKGDYGTRKTDTAVRRAEWRLSRVYRQAQRDIDENLKAWREGHERREERYRQMVKDGKMSQADFDAWMRGQVFQDKQWQARKEEIDRVLLNADREAQRIINEGKIGVFADNANYIGYELEHNGNVNTGFTLYDQNTVGRLIKSDPQILPKPAPGVQKDKAYTYYNKLMNSAITQGIVQGETIPQIAKRIVNTTGERSYSSAVRNARTAYTGAQNAGRMEGLHQAQRLGINVKKKWMATLDNRTRDAHADLDGQIRDVDEPFDSELGPIDYPGDPNADPGNVYNCRCTLVYVYPDYPSEMQRRDNETGEIVGDMTYREWEQMKQGDGEKPEPEVKQNAPEMIGIMANGERYAYYPETLGGMERGEEMSFADANNRAANPGYKKGAGTSQNCQSCVIAHEARLRGYDVEARTFTGNKTAEELSHNSRIAWVDPKTGGLPDFVERDMSVTYDKRSYYGFLQDNVTAEGRYTLQFNWANAKGGHIISVDRDKTGALRLYDPQIGRTYDKDWEIEDYLGRMDFKGTDYFGRQKAPELLRIDNLAFNEEVANGVTAPIRPGWGRKQAEEDDDWAPF